MTPENQQQQIIDPNQENNQNQMIEPEPNNEDPQQEPIRSIRRPKIYQWSCINHPFLYCEDQLVQNNFDSGVAIFAIAYLTAADCPITLKLNELQDFRRQLAHWILNSDLPY